MKIAATYRSKKNIVVMPPGELERVCVPDFDFSTQEWVYQLTQDQNDRYAQILIHGGAVEIQAED